MIYTQLIQRMEALADEQQATHLMRFFKTGPGEYGEGDRFLGLRVPQTRALVKEFRSQAGMADIPPLLDSPWHEVRLAGFLLLIELYQQAKKRRDNTMLCHIVDFYLSAIEHGNNWDLVDVVAPKILGDYLLDRPEERHLLYQLAAMDGRLWHQRVAMVATWTMISGGAYDDALRLAEGFLTHRHDLMHKASGWMMREIGKRGGMTYLLDFLDRHAPHMPRTMLRYAIERLSPEQRQYYMKLTDSAMRSTKYKN